MSGIKVKLADGNNWLKVVGYTIDEESEIYDSLLQDVYENPRWYLNSLEYLPEFRVSWKRYSNSCPTLPRKPKKQKAL